jgi:hypothetical protein
MACLGNLPAKDFPLFKQLEHRTLPCHSFVHLIILLYYPKKGADVNHDSQIFYVLYFMLEKWECLHSLIIIRFIFLENTCAMWNIYN